MQPHIDFRSLRVTITGGTSGLGRALSHLGDAAYP